MSVPPEMMKLMAGSPAGAGGAPGGMPGGPAAPPQNGAAGGAPMSTPQENQGEKQNAVVNVSLAMDLMEQTIAALGAESEEGQAVLKALGVLSGAFAKARAKAQEFAPAELMQMMSALPQGGGTSPEAKAMGGMPPGGAPGGARPPMQ